MAERSLIAEIEEVFASGSTQKQVEILRRVTDLFLTDTDAYSDAQIDLFDDVILRIAERIETRARAELAVRLAAADRAPPRTIRRLAHDPAIEVAGPILSHSARLTDVDLLEIAAGAPQDRLLAISKRATLSADVGDALVLRGNRDVVLSVAQNEGARFSDDGYGRLVDRSIDDEVLAICVAMRKDIPRAHFHALIAKASDVVFAKLAANNPEAVDHVHQVLAGITGQEAAAEQPRDYRGAAARFETLRRTGAPLDEAIQECAARGHVEDATVALSALAGAPIDLVETVLSDRRGDNDLVLILAKAGGLSWRTARQLCVMRRGPGGLSPHAAESARQSFDRLRPETARRVVRFYNERHAAVANFRELADHIRGKESGPRQPRFSGQSSRA